VEYLEAIGEERSTYGTHYENVAVGQELGLEPVYTLVSNQDDWTDMRHCSGMQRRSGRVSIRRIPMWKRC